MAHRVRWGARTVAILGAYGLTGLILTAIFWRASDRAITITASILLGLAALGAVLLAAGGTLLATVLPAEVMLSGEGDPLATELMNGLPNYFYAALMRLGIWVLATPMTVLALLVPAAVMLGMLAASLA